MLLADAALTQTPGTVLRTSAGPNREQRVERMVQHYHAFVWRSLRRLGVPEPELDDATQEVFIVAVRRLEDIVRGSERSFLFSTALGVASTMRRSKERRREELDAEMDTRTSVAPGQEELVERFRARQVLDKILDQMSLEQRAVFVLYEIEGMTAAEIAEFLEVPPGTVASRLRAARSLFFGALEKSRPAKSSEERGEP
jgi:RNA polymerase sigma-70 factor, ECF subfamily